MNKKQATYLLEFFKKYRIFSNIEDLELLSALLKTPTDGRGINKLLNLNSSYISHEIIRKVPKSKREEIKKTNGSWIYNILIYLDKCPICGGTKNNLKNTTCSVSCANTHFRSGEDNAHYLGNNYRTICFAWHNKECIICKESNIVEVHHFDEDHNNNTPDNLIPLCPTHHQYWHSNYKYLIEQTVITYRDKFISTS